MTALGFCVSLYRRVANGHSKEKDTVKKQHDKMLTEAARTRKKKKTQHFVAISAKKKKRKPHMRDKSKPR